MKELGIILKRLRRENGLSQEKMAEQAKISVSYYKKLENGKGNPSLMVFVFLSNAFKIKPSDLAFNLKNQNIKMKYTLYKNNRKIKEVNVEILTVFRHLIYTMRKEKKLTQKKFAQIAKINVKYFGKIERGESVPSLKKILSICSALNITLSDFFQKAEEILYI